MRASAKGDDMKLALATGLASLISMSAMAQDVNTVDFALLVNPQFSACVGPNPQASVEVIRGNLNDKLTITITGIRPNLAFDLFTVQRSSLDPTGQPVANFPGFGLAWYQSDLQANDSGVGRATINTILLDQIFGFDADKVPVDTTVAATAPAAPATVTRVPPTNTFHVGFWFNDPQDAVACGFDATKPTPFNGEHKAGPLAMISVPSAATKLGPLCTKPTGISEADASKDETGLTFVCNP